jgi:pyruvate/2-oxoglutarate dehydrogenase complex dihydrolipoamide dehydrogenase (E3) component
VSTRWDLVVLGLGVGGSEVALRAAEAGLKVLAVEQGLVGGECPYWGCIPSKAMTRAAQALGEVERAVDLAGSASAKPSWPVLAARVRQVSEHWEDSAAATRLQEAGVTLRRGSGRIVGTNEIDVDGDHYVGSKGLVVATGTQPALPAIDGLASVPFWTNHQAIEAMAAPRSLIVLGGGAVGVELAQVFRRFGTHVTLVERDRHVLPMEEPENAEAMEQVLRRDGIRLHTGTTADLIEHAVDGVAVRLTSGVRLHAERLLVAVGRHADLQPLGVSEFGLDPLASHIPTDSHLRAADGVWAVGDVTGRGLFTHVAYYQAQIAAADILSQAHADADYTAVPRVTYTDPELGSVGLTETDARARGLDIRVGVLPVKTSDRAWLYGKGADLGVVKLVVDAATDTLVGGSVLSPNAGEIAALLALAIRARIPTSLLTEVIYPYPTFTRAIRGALRRLS